jgi:hypothetical protein
MLSTQSRQGQPVNWIPLATNIVSASGLIQFTNTPSGGTDFYRTRSVP